MTTTAAQLTIAYPDEHGELLHPPSGRGRVTVARRLERFSQRVVSIRDLPWVLRQVAGLPDAYVTPNRFNGPRSLARLCELAALWVDLDAYKAPGWATAEPWVVRDAALRLLEDAGIPAPCFAVATGRGVCLYWFHSAVPRAALPRWQACQRRLLEVLRPLGADPLAVDAARVLRPVGTVNGRNGLRVESISPATPAWDFENLADEVLPCTREEYREHQAELRSLAAARAARRADGTRPRPVKALGFVSWAETLLTDLQRLREHRWWGELPPGQRDAWMFLAATNMAWLAPPRVLVREVYELGRQAASWSERETNERCAAVFRRAAAAAGGHTIEWQGLRYDPRYRWKAETVIRWLEISAEEMRAANLRGAITADVDRERERTRWHSERGGKGQTRAEYLATNTASRERPWEALGISRRWYYQLKRRGAL